MILKSVRYYVRRAILGIFLQKAHTIYQASQYMIPHFRRVVKREKEKSLQKTKKGVDKRTKRWYNIRAVWKTYGRNYAGMAELADARDLKSREIQLSYRFDPGFRHHLYRGVEQSGSSSGS